MSRSVCRLDVVSTATRYGLDLPGIVSRWGRYFRRPSRPALGLTQPLYNGYRIRFPGVKRPGRGVNQPPPLITEVKEGIELYLYLYEC